MPRNDSIYDALPVDSKSIRILTLLPSDHRASEIHCELKSVEVLDTNHSVKINSSFQALSYTWGDPDLSHTITCNRSEFKITSNLFDALWHLRWVQGARNLWVDAICINQESVDEKSVQVPLMKHVYHQATGVVIWLGLEDQWTKEAIRIIRIASRCMLKEIRARAAEQSPVVLTTEEFDDQVNIARGLPSKEKSDQWQSLVRLLDRKWFSRCWIKQESALASHAVVQVGSQLFTWSELCHAMRFFAYRSYSKMSPDIHGAIWKAFDLCRTSQIGQQSKWKPLPLLILLESTRHLEATMEVDKIYSLLGLAEEGPQVTVNYQISTTDLCTEVTRLLLQPPSSRSTFPLEVLAHVHSYSTPSGQKLETAPDEHLPSWVVYWHNPKRDDIARNHEDKKKPMRLASTPAPLVSHRFNAGGVEYPGPIIDPSTPYEISLSGIVFTEVSRIFGLDPFSRSPTWDMVSEIWSAMQDRSPEYPNGEAPDEAFAQTLTVVETIHPQAVGKSGEIYHAVDFQQFCVTAYQNAILMMTKEGRTADIETLNKEWGAKFLTLKSLVRGHTCSSNFTRDVKRTCVKRPVFWTKSGHFGIGYATMSPGDLVCVMLGGRTPYLLRPVDSGKYRFVGECYLHGIMHGEVLEEGLSRKKLFTLV